MYSLKLVFRSPNAVAISQNRHDAEWLVNQEIVDHKRSITILSSGVDTTVFQPDNSKMDREYISVLFAARLLRNKGLLPFLESSRLLAESGIDAKFFVAGEVDPGNPQSFTASDLPELFSDSCVQYLGHVDAMPELFRDVDVFVLPTTYGEGVPKSLIEAAASGLALVATDVPGCLEVVEHAVNGVVISTQDECQMGSEIAVALAQMHRDRALLARIKESARKTAIEKFQSEKIYRQTEAIYSCF